MLQKEVKREKLVMNENIKSPTSNGKLVLEYTFDNNMHGYLMK